MASARRPRLSPELVSQWLRDLREHPVELTPEDLEGIEDPMDEDLALRQDPDGTPAWWPASHPNCRDGQRLSSEERRAWFADFLAGTLSPIQATLGNAEPGARRRWIAATIHRIASGFDVENLPTPDLEAPPGRSDAGGGKSPPVIGEKHAPHRGLAIWALVLLITLAFLAFVWPTRYRDIPVRSGITDGSISTLLAARENRFTGRVEVLTPWGWRAIRPAAPHDLVDSLWDAPRSR